MKIVQLGAFKFQSLISREHWRVSPQFLANVAVVLFDFRFLQISEFFMVLMSLGVTFRDGYVVVETLSRAEKLNFWQSLISEEEKSLTTVHF